MRRRKVPRVNRQSKRSLAAGAPDFCLACPLGRRICEGGRRRSAGKPAAQPATDHLIVMRAATFYVGDDGVSGPFAGRDWFAVIMRSQTPDLPWGAQNDHLDE